MRHLLGIGLGVVLFSGGAYAQVQSDKTTDMSKIIASLNRQCGYALDTSLLSKITGYTLDTGLRARLTAGRSIPNSETEIFSVDFYLDIFPKKRHVTAVLSFGCYLPTSEIYYSYDGSLRELNRDARTARDIIEQEDSGGRYYRHIVWERPYTGMNWKGTIAYVDWDYGDGQKGMVPAYFLVCPDKEAGVSSCFSLEAKHPEKLTAQESNAIPNLLHGVSVTPRQEQTSQVDMK